MLILTEAGCFKSSRSGSLLYSPRPFGRLIGKLDTLGSEIIEKSEGELRRWKGRHGEAQQCFRRGVGTGAGLAGHCPLGLAPGQGARNIEKAGEAVLPEILNPDCGHGGGT